ncbi:hypothetical protein BSL78_30120 [Apostichopus japonicus]|uniref:Sulfotransferase family protein n=1 Tax=Stichopus japonicus TaxID=307972 RepID=A0A2G8JBE9_STIJA|nr:hypothetical protein BSL78_30120 [Apostichopus japonicus]
MEGNLSSNTAKKVFLWCVPRSVSTAVLKCMSNVAGVEAWHEPYAVSHVTTTLYNPTFMPDNVKLNKIRQKLFHPDPKLVELAYSSLPRGRLQDQKLFSYSWVKEQLELNPPEGKNFVFVKDMAFAVRKIHGELPAGYRHTFLIRDPVAVFQSWKRLIATDMYRTEDVESVDINTDAPFFPIHEVFKDTYDLWKYAKEKGEENPVVIDTDDLLNHPDVILPKYFKAIGVEFDEKYITWEKKSEDR